MKLIPATLVGVVSAPPSKSAAHRALILAYSAGEAVVSPVAMSDDMKATVGCLTALGADVAVSGASVTVKRGKLPDTAVLDVKESGSTMRFFLPIAAALGVPCTFVGAGKLPSRPYAVFAEELTRHGAEFSTTLGLPVTVGGRLRGGTYTIPGNVSSQFISGLLMTLPTLKEDSRIVLTSPLESKGYVDLTVKMLSDAEVFIVETADGYATFGGQCVSAARIAVEGDYSNAAVFLAAGALAGDVTVTGLDSESTQGDREIVDILLRMGAKVSVHDDKIRVQKSNLTSIDVDVSQIPDLAPVIAVLLAAGDGTGRLKNAARLRLKECDRFAAIIYNLNAAGVSAAADGDDIVICGGSVRGGSLSGFSDHRMVMSAALLGLLTPVTVTDDTAVNKSFPDFFDRYRALGGRAEAENGVDC